MKPQVTWCRCFILVLLLLVSIAATAARAQAEATYPTDSVIFGTTYSGWSAAWWQWAASLPATQHPLFDTADCSTGQSGPVWFLGGSFCSGSDPSFCIPHPERYCTVPKGKALFFPLWNWSCLNAEWKINACPFDPAIVNPPTVPLTYFMREGLAFAIDKASELKVTVDGKPVQGNLMKLYRVQSPIFTVSLPDDSLYPRVGENIPAGDYWGVDDGYYVMLEPLPPGKHVLTFKSASTYWNSVQEFTYHLTIPK